MDIIIRLFLIRLVIPNCSFKYDVDLVGNDAYMFFFSHFFQIDHIFLTRVCSETAGGLPGLFLYLFLSSD